MFTNKTIKLSEIQKEIEFNLINDGEIAFAGKIGNKNPYLSNMLVYALNQRFVHKASRNSKISAIIISDSSLKNKVIDEGKGLILSEDPKSMLKQIQTFLVSKKNFQWKDFKTKISHSANINAKAVIADKNVIIGDGSSIGPYCVVNERSIIGKNCNINESVVIGSEAFELTGLKSNRSIMPQSGGVLIGNNVTIQALSTVVRSTFGGFTSLKDNVKVDSHVHIAHDAQVEKNTSIAASTFIAGNVTIGENVFIGPNSTISNGINIANEAWVTIGSNVIESIEEGKRVTGNFAIDHNQFLKKFKKN